jgi:hypothetical protein
MQVLSATATAGLVLKAKADTTTFPGGAGALKTGTATIGDATATTYADADVGYSVEITADDAGDVASISLLDGSQTQVTGTPVFDPSTAIDFSGVSLPGMDTVYAVRIRCDSDNQDLVVVSGLPNAMLVSIPVGAGQTLLICFASTGYSLTAETINFTFATAGDSATVEILSSATPA